MIEIEQASNQEDIEIARKLFLEYQQWLNTDLCFQGFEQELANLPGKYAEPSGAILLAKYQGEIIGCVAVRPLKGDICEMKRLWVRPEFQGLSAGRLLAESIIKKARELGYKTMQLDTLQRLNKAIKLYQQLGFKQIKPYYDNPLDEVVYWELALFKD